MLLTIAQFVGKGMFWVLAFSGGGLAVRDLFSGKKAEVDERLH